MPMTNYEVGLSLPLPSSDGDGGDNGKAELHGSMPSADRSFLPLGKSTQIDKPQRSRLRPSKKPKERGKR
jgi:hypothetical protein